MERNEKETHNFMNVESFSQLPFIRPTPPVKDKPSIRLFGMEFGANKATTGAGSDQTTTESVETTTEDNSSTAEKKTAPFENGTDNNNNNNNNKIINNNNNQRFECHYCCRNFPTSQALGGHQNAHKRERQHAKRAHLQSVMVHNSLSDAHIYAQFLNYNRAPSTTTNYPTWNTTNSNSGGSKYFSSYSSSAYNSQSQPINGSPLGLWRIPSVQNSAFNRDHSLIRSNSINPMINSGDDHHQVHKANSSSHLLHHHQNFNGGSSSQSRYVNYETKSSVKDPVSLDLHL